MAVKKKSKAKKVTKKKTKKPVAASDAQVIKAANEFATMILETGLGEYLCQTLQDGVDLLFRILGRKSPTTPASKSPKPSAARLRTLFGIFNRALDDGEASWGDLVGDDADKAQKLFALLKLKPARLSGSGYLNFGFHVDDIDSDLADGYGDIHGLTVVVTKGKKVIAKATDVDVNLEDNDNNTYEDALASV